MTEQYIARRMERIVPFYVMDLLAKAKQMEAAGRSVVHMEVGQPDFAAPPPVVAAGKAAIDAGKTGYTPATGIPELRQAVADYYRDHFGRAVDPQRIIVTPGSSGGLQLLMGVLINPGQEVLMTDPGYPCNKNFVEFVSGVPVSLPVGPETDYQLTAEMVRQAWTERSRAVMVASPANPTGTVLSREELQNIHQVVRERGGVLIVDEIYQGLIYESEAFTALDVADDIFVLNSFSKYFGMTGWRLGYMAGPKPIADAVAKIQSQETSAPSSISQKAGLAAYTGSMKPVEEMRAAFRERRDYIVEALRAIPGVHCFSPAGAFYVFPDIRAFLGKTDPEGNPVETSTDLALFLLEKHGVAVVPGDAFGEPAGIRLSYAASMDHLKEAMARIRDGLSSLI